MRLTKVDNKKIVIFVSYIAYYKTVNTVTHESALPPSVFRKQRLGTLRNGFTHILVLQNDEDKRPRQIDYSAITSSSLWETLIRTQFDSVINKETVRR
jgi:hypothetical protein